MAPRPPYFANYTAAIKIMGLISVFFHAGLLCAIAWLFPFVSAPATDEAVTIDLAYLGTSGEYAHNNKHQSPLAARAPASPQDAGSFTEKTTMGPGAAPSVKKAPAMTEPASRAALKQKPKEPIKNPPRPSRKSAAESLRLSPDKVKTRAGGSSPLEAAASPRKAGINGPQAVSAPAAESHNPKPSYPELARKRGQEGTARIRCEVDMEGNVAAASIAASSGHKLLDDAALKTVRKWRFKPAFSQGRPARGIVIVPVEFRLR